MIKKNWKLMLLTSVVILLPIVAGVVLWPQLPDQLPFHWNMSGEVDGWASKPVAVFGMPAMLLAFHWTAMLVTAADPKKSQQSPKMLQLVFWLVPLISVVISAAIYFSALGNDLPVERFVPVVLGMLFAIIGNYLPKCKQSYTIGIKVPWTLHSEANWNLTHRLAGWLWMVCGLVMVLASFLNLIWLLPVLALVMALVPVIYSYLLYRKGV